MIVETLELISESIPITDIEQRLNDHDFDDILANHSFLIMTDKGLVKVKKNKEIVLNPVVDLSEYSTTVQIQNYAVPKIGPTTITVANDSSESTPLTILSGNTNACYLAIQPKNSYIGKIGISNDKLVYDYRNNNYYINLTNTEIAVYGENAHAEGGTDNKALDIVTQSDIDNALKEPEDGKNITPLVNKWSQNNKRFALAGGLNSHIEGTNNLTLAKNAHAEGNGTIAAHHSDHSEGTGSRADGPYAHAGGLETIANGMGAFAHGLRVKVSASHDYDSDMSGIALGANDSTFNDVNVTGKGGIAIGHNARATALRAIAIGDNVTANGERQIVIGKYNQSNNDTKTYRFIIGTGTSTSNKKNGLVLTGDTNAKLWVAGDIMSGGTPTNPQYSLSEFVNYANQINENIQSLNNYRDSINTHVDQMELEFKNRFGFFAVKKLINGLSGDVEFSLDSHMNLIGYFDTYKLTLGGNDIQNASGNIGDALIVPPAIFDQNVNDIVLILQKNINNVLTDVLSVKLSKQFENQYLILGNLYIVPEEEPNNSGE